MKPSFRLAGVILACSLALAIGYALYDDSRPLTAPQPAPRPKPVMRRPPPPPQPLPAIQIVAEAGSKTKLSVYERSTLTTYAHSPDLRAKKAEEIGGKRLHEILDNGLADDPVLVAGVVVMHESQSHFADNKRNCWNEQFIGHILRGQSVYSPRNAYELAECLWSFESYEGCKDRALELLLPHDHLRFTDRTLRAEYHCMIGLCKRENPRYPGQESRREFREASALYAEAGDRVEAASSKLEEIKAIMDGDDAVRDKAELTTELAACAELLTGVAKEHEIWGRYWFIGGRFHRDLHTATRDPQELVLSERLLRDAKVHKKEHKAEKDGSYYNLLIIHAEASLLLAIAQRRDAAEDIQTAIDDLLEVINGNSSDLGFQDYNYALMLLKNAYAKTMKMPLYLELLQSHRGRKTDAPGLAAALELERERIRKLLEERTRASAPEPATTPH